LSDTNPAASLGGLDDAAGAAVGRQKAIILAVLAWYSVAAAALGQNVPAQHAEPSCATYASSDLPGMGKFKWLVEMLQAGLTYHWYGERTIIDATVMTPAEEERYLEDFCRSHPDSGISAASKDLVEHMAELTAAKGLTAAPIPDDVQAQADVRAFVVAHAMNFRTSDAVVDYQGPDFLPGLEHRLAKDVTGKIARVPDMLSLEFNDSGAAVPEFPPGFKALAVVRPRLRNSDIPPGDDEDSIVRSEGVPTFYIGANGHDVWEVGKIAGVASVRRVSEGGVGPWEPFENDRTQYRHYSQRLRDGRTAEENFVDPHTAALVLAACRGDASAMAKDLKEGADPNAKGAGGDTPVFWALACNNMTGLEGLLKAGADPNYQLPGTVLPTHDRDPSAPATYTVDNYSALHLAMSVHNFGAVKILLEYGGVTSANDADRTEHTTLYLGLTDSTWDAHKGELPGWDLRQAVLDADKNLVRGCETQPVVDRLAVGGRYDLVEELLKRGYDCELPDLAWDARMRQHWYPEDDSERLRVNEILKQKGVAFPPRSRFDRWAEVGMNTDGTLTVHWGDLHSRHGAVDPNPDQVIKKGEPFYDMLIARVGGLKPGEKKLIARHPDDATD
jgi:hypothetical protein